MLCQSFFISRYISVLVLIIVVDDSDVDNVSFGVDDDDSVGV